MIKNNKRKTHKIVKRKRIKSSRSGYIVHRHTNRHTNRHTKADRIPNDRISNKNSSIISDKIADLSTDRSYEEPINIMYSASSPKLTYSRVPNFTYNQVSSLKYGKISNRTYKNSFSKSNNLTDLKRLTVFILFFVIVCFVINIGLSNINHIWIDSINLIEQVDVEKYKSVMNNSLPIINVTYNSGNIGNPLSVQLKSIIKGVFGFDINTPISILNTQSPYMYVYYKNNYLPHFAVNISGDINGEEQEFYENGENSANGIDVNKENSDDINKMNGNEGSGSSDDISSRGNNGTQYEQKDNIEEVQDGIMSYCYYEGEEEKLDTPKENIISGQKIAIMNMTDYKIDIDKDINKLLKEPLNINLDRDGPKILILHTHTTEGFIKNLGDINNKNVPNWSTNPQENVVRIGHELAEQLKKTYGYDVVHNGTVHDRPDYNKSYDNSYLTIQKYLKSYPSIQVVLDIHRDGLSKEQPKLRVVKNIDGKNAAQIMFVIGTDGYGRSHPNWKENFKLALKLQDTLNSYQPGLARHVYISKNRYNQHFTNGSLIIEIGGDGNLLSECLESVKYLSKAISEVIK